MMGILNSLPTKSMFSAEGRIPLKSVGFASLSPKSRTLPGQPFGRISRIGPMNLVFIAALNVAVSAIGWITSIYAVTMGD